MFAVYLVSSVSAVTETGALVVPSVSGSQLPAYSGDAAHAIWIAGAQKLVPDLSATLRRVEEHALPSKATPAQKVYGQPSAVNRILNAQPHPGAAPFCCCAKPSDSDTTSRTRRPSPSTPPTSITSGPFRYSHQT
ncbi:LUD domain-containing protein [Nonomuraea jiangxiensis]|uniref:Uncharacterized ACR, YkgG family COG1556 n=1 Tax=Nonomuraea jiangxiensis TaxID=633440 RepID=A0A1G9MS13_9ACTN|nr:LUD domain-containing protein [Nonomuraea jiangxiensis]SDL77058.1 Uncharacterised ACR, YkgG family COG1556 [Nonomuraea jiangxiensis]